MSYIVLARKYRPQTFNEIYAQEHITQILANAIKTRRIAHAYLFNGPRGVGKTSMARILAKSLNCEQGPSDSPCGVCSNCREITAGTSNDVIEIDAASNTGVEDVRELQRDLIYAPSQSLYKIYIIDEVHMLSKSAFNALLKTLEEPPENVIFIFATTEPHKVLPTIISRCQRFDFRRIPVESITARLQEIAGRENITIDYESLFLIARKSDGGLRDALSLLDQILSYSDGTINLALVQQVFGELPLEIYVSIMEAIINHDAMEIIGQYHEITNRGIDLVEFLNSFMEFVRQLLMLKLGVPLKGLVKEDIQIMTTLIDRIKPDNLMYMISMLIRLKQDIRTSSHPSLMIEVVLIQMTRLDEMQEIDAIMESLKGLPEGIQIVTAPVTAKPELIAVNNVEKKTAKTDEPIVLEYSAPKKEIEINREYIVANWATIMEKVKKEKMVLANTLSKAQVTDYKNGMLYIDVESQLQYNSVTENQVFINEVFTTFLNQPVRVLAKVNSTSVKMVNRTPTLQDIEKTNPDLAKLIESTNSLIMPGYKRD